MLATELKPEHRDLLLGCEIAGLLHDLGKLHPEFARESLAGGKNLSDAVKSHGFDAAHGAILDAGKRAYPPVNADEWLQQLRQHEGWAHVLSIPAEWGASVQADGLGAPLRQHHANAKFGSAFSLLGDLYTFGADIRDSALDKGSGGTKSGKQALERAFIADSFGNETEAYGPQTLAAQWERLGAVLPGLLFGDEAWQAVAGTRAALREVLRPIFLDALGETRRPTNDVTLWHHSASTAGLFRVATAEGVLRENFGHWADANGKLDMCRLGRIRFRLLAVRWDWARLTAGALQPAVFAMLGERRTQALDQLRALLETRVPVGHCVYEDDDGAIYAVPGCFEPDAPDAGESLFRIRVLDPLQPDILTAIAPLGTGAPVCLAWSEPRLYLTDHHEVITEQPASRRVRSLQVGENVLHTLWACAGRDGGQVEICPQCGLRPGASRERALNASKIDPDDTGIPAGYCDECAALTPRDDPDFWQKRRRAIEATFRVVPSTFNLQKLGPADSNNPRVVLLSLQVDAAAILRGELFLTQCARPVEDQTEAKSQSDNKKRESVHIRSATDAGTHLDSALRAIEQGKMPHVAKPKTPDDRDEPDGKLLRQLVGDSYWLRDDDGRTEATDLPTRARELLDGFFLRESIPADAGLVRHDGDRLALFGQRKHASPGRLARTWDDLRTLWRDCAAGADALTGGQWLPISLDARGLRLIVAADDAGAVLGTWQRLVLGRLARVRAGLPVHVSALAFKVKFPLYVAFDALRRLEARAGTLPADTWTLADTHQRDGLLQLGWNTGRGRVEWAVPLRSGDPAQPDLWYPHAICSSRAQGPDRIVRLDRLQAGETITLRPSTFDFAVLEGSTRRYALRYDAAGRRPHVVLGAPGRQPYLLEHLPDIAGPANRARRSGWNTSEGQGLLGEFIDRWGRWVRDVPEVLRAQGIEACRCYVDGRLRQHLPKPEQAELRAWLLDHLEDGGLFDAFEWTGFVEKAAYQIASSLQKDRPAGVIPADSTEEPSA